MFAGVKYVHIFYDSLDNVWDSQQCLTFAVTLSLMTCI